MPNRILQPYQGVFTLQDIEQQVIKSFPYENFFQGQKESIIAVVNALMNNNRSHVILEAPTGVGKTVIASTVHRTIDALLGSTRFKTTVTTTTKGLQAQYEKETSTYDLKGKTNYRCPIGYEYYSTMGCKTAVKRKECSPRSECPYFSRRLRWTESSYWRCTNTAMFIEMCPMLCMEETNMADMVVIDECHKFPETLLDHTETEFHPEYLQPLNTFYGRVHETYVLALEVTNELKKLYASQVGKLITFPESMINKIDTLNEQLNKFLEVIETKLKTEEISPQIQEVCWRLIERCQKWSDVCEILTDCGVRDFIVRVVDDEGVILKPVRVSDVSRYGAFRKADYFLHMSATICGLEAYAKQMGIPEGSYETIAMAHPVDVERRLVNYIPIVKMSGGQPDENKLTAMVRAIEELADNHANKNGLIHTASYKLAEDLMKRSKYKQKMFIGRDRKQTMEILAMNAQQGTGVIVLSPSMQEGYDLSQDLARWQVIAKIPFGYLGDPAIKYVADNEHGQYMRATVLGVVQSCGRVVRGIDDFGTTYILDSSFDMVLSKGEKYIPSWFTEAVRGY